MGMNVSDDELKYQQQQKAQQQQAAAAKSNVKNVNDDDFYNTGSSKSTHEAYEAVKNNSLFADDHVECYQSRMENAIDTMLNNEEWRVSMDADGDGQAESMKLLDAIAASFDSELDLYIQDKLQGVMNKYGTCSKSYLSDEALEELASYGIVATAIGEVDENGEVDYTNRVYAFSLYDPDDISYNKQTHEYEINGEILTDANGKKGSIVFGDCLIPDGYAQGAESNLSSILDQMGIYENMVTEADFIGREGQYDSTIAQIETNIANDYYNENGGSAEDLYGATKNIRQAVTNLWGGDGSAPGAYRGSGSSSAASGTAAANGSTTTSGSLSQSAFNEKVEEYIEQGYDVNKATSIVNSEYNVNMGYNGDAAETADTQASDKVVTKLAKKAPSAKAA